MGCQNSNLSILPIGNQESKELDGYPYRNTSNQESKSLSLMNKDFQVYYLIEVIISREESCLLLSEQFFLFIKKLLLEFYFADSTKSKLIKILEEYIDISFSFAHDFKKQIVNQRTTNFMNKIYKEMQSIYQQLFGTQQFPKLLNFFSELTEKQQNFSYKLSLEGAKQLFELSDYIISQPSLPDNLELFFIAYHLVMGCRNEESKGIKMRQIDENLRSTLIMLNQKYIDTPYKNVDDDLKFIFYGIRQQKFQKIKTQKFVQDNCLYKILHLSGDVYECQQELENEIIEMVEQGKKEKQFFSSFMNRICKQNYGYNFKCGLKLQSKEDVKSMERVKQKILFNRKEDKVKDKNLNYKTINELIDGEKKNHEKAMKRFLTSTNKLEIKISDILRGKCMFPSLEDVNEATERIMNEVKNQAKNGEDLMIVQVENRLKGITNDVVLKIKIRKIIAEFQLMFFQKKDETTQNAIYHKMYEIGRSKVYSAIFILFDWFEKISMKFMSMLNSIIEKRSDFEAMNKKKFSKFLIEIRKAEGKQMKSQSQILKEVRETLQKTNKRRMSIEIKIVNSETEQRTGDCYTSMKLFKKAFQVYDSILKRPQTNAQIKKRVLKKINKIQMMEDESKQEDKENMKVSQKLKNSGKGPRVIKLKI